MRTYPTDSPHATARIVALTALADGHVSKNELDALERPGACEQIGIDRHAMHAVLHSCCEDLLLAQHSHWTGTCQIEPDALSQLLAEIEDTELRRAVLRLCLEVVHADQHFADGECIVISSAAEQWGLRDEWLGASSPASSH